MKIISYIDIGPAIPVQICNSYPKTIAEGRIKYPCLFGHIYKRAVIISHELVSCQRVALLTQGRISIGTERVYRVIEHEHVQITIQIVIEKNSLSCKPLQVKPIERRFFRKPRDSHLNGYLINKELILSVQVHMFTYYRFIMVTYSYIIHND